MKLKITDHSHDEYITTPEISKLRAENSAARLAQANLVTKAAFDNKLINLNKEINSNKTKHLLVENEFKKLQTFDSIYFRGKNYFEDDGTQNYLVFDTSYKYFKISNSTNRNLKKSKGLSNESIKPPSTTNNTLDPLLKNLGGKARVEFKGSCLKQDKITFNQ